MPDRHARTKKEAKNMHHVEVQFALRNQRWNWETRDEGFEVASVGAGVWLGQIRARSRFAHRRCFPKPGENV